MHSIINGSQSKLSVKSQITKAWVFVLRVRPMGQALILALVVMTISSTAALFLMPSVGTLEMTVHKIPEAYEDGAHGPVIDGALVGDEFPGCRWRLPADISQNGLTGPPAPRRVLCDEYDAAEKVSNEYPIKMLRERFYEDAGWQVASDIYSLRLPDHQPPLALVVYFGILLLVAGVLLRDLPFRADLIRARYAVFHKPWILAIAPLAMFAGAALFNTVLPMRLEYLEETMDLFQATAPGALGIILVIPLFEEAVFRQWLYQRTIDRLPVWTVAVGSAWVFMLIHVFNPQVQAMPGYLPTVFLGGLVFFWMRHWFGSFSLAALAHILSNGLAVGVGWVMQN